jgi:2-C-methyl-D-erythritol 4-phosphate cytidylyltransferase
MKIVSAVIVAAGKGTRMNGDLPKQYLLLESLPILCHTLMVFESCDMIQEIVVVIPAQDTAYCRENILAKINIGKKLLLVCGGENRQDSVYKGLLAAGQRSDIVVIHDAVRPFIRSEQLNAVIKGAEQFGACILGIPAYDTLKEIDYSATIVKTIQRDRVWLAQTPQAFQYDLIKKAHTKARRNEYLSTDDASLVEWLGARVKIIYGSRDNIKITNQEDLEIARALMGFKLNRTCKSGNRVYF